MKHPRPKLWMARSAAVSLSIFAGLLLCEILARIIVPREMVGIPMEQAAWGGDINRAAVVVRHQFQQRLTYLRFNEDHLRGAPIGSATNRVLVLGDSFAFGWLVEETNTFVARFNRSASAEFPPGSFEVLNGGAPSWGTSDYVAFVEGYAKRLHPAAIVVFLNNDDVARSVRHALYRLDPANSNAVVAVDPALAGAGPRDTSRASWLFRWTVAHIELVQLVRINLQGKDSFNTQQIPALHGKEDPAHALQLERALFLRLRDWCAAKHCRLLVLTTGYNGFPKFPLGWNDGIANGMFFREAPDFFSRNGITFHDLGPELSRAVGGDFTSIVIPKDFHPNERGHELIAQLAWPWLKLQLQEILAAKTDNPR